MKEGIYHPSELKPTYIHSWYSAKSQRKEKKRKFKDLDYMLCSRGRDDMPTIAAIQDPDSGELLVYSGNINHAHATKRKYRLKVTIITSQEDLNQFNSTNEVVSTLGVTDFQEMLGDLRISAKYPKAEKDMPKHEFSRLKKKQEDWRQKKAWEMMEDMGKLAGWDDED